MYLTSHHVLAPSTRREGVNSLLYLHGPRTWPQAPAGIPDTDPGTLAVQSISIRPPGNCVRSYLDIVAPDEARWDEVRIGMMDFVGALQRGPLPWVGLSGRLGFP